MIKICYFASLICLISCKIEVEDNALVLTGKNFDQAIKKYQCILAYLAYSYSYRICNCASLYFTSKPSCLKELIISNCRPWKLNSEKLSNLIFICGSISEMHNFSSKILRQRLFPYFLTHSGLLNLYKQ